MDRHYDITADADGEDTRIYGDQARYWLRHPERCILNILEKVQNSLRERSELQDQKRANMIQYST